MLSNHGVGQILKSTRNRGLLVGVAFCSLAGLTGSLQAAVIDVGLSNASTTTSTGNSTNGGINPITYTPVQVTVPDAPSETYDAADTFDTGTTWNSLESVSTAPTSSVTPILYQQNLPLVDSNGNSTSVELNVSAIEGSGKTDYLHTGSNVPTSADTDGLDPNPANSTYLVSGTPTNGNGYTASNVQRLLMGNEFIANGVSDGMQFEFTGLTPNQAFSLYVYGAGTTNGQGANFTLAAANGGASATTNSNTAARYLSVFASDGVSPGPEQGLSWNLLTGVADANGDINFTALASETTGAVKPAVNGFQLDLGSTSVPEPASLGLLAGIGAIFLRRRHH